MLVPNPRDEITERGEDVEGSGHTGQARLDEMLRDITAGRSCSLRDTRAYDRL